MNKTTAMFEELLSGLPWLQVLVAAVAYFGLGALWYGAVFSKAWVRGHRIDVNDPNLKKGSAATMIASFFVMLIICIALSMVLRVASVTDAEHAVKWGLLLGFGFSFASTSISFLYLKKPLSIHLIDGLYHVTGMVIASVILTLWN